MKQQRIIEQDLSSLHIIRDELCLEMVEATPSQLNKLEAKLKEIEEIIILKESSYEE